MKKLPEFTIILLEKEYTAKFDQENSELIIDDEKKLRNIARTDIIKIRDMNNCFVNSKSELYFWYVEKCIHVNSDYVLFKVKYFVNDPLNRGKALKRKYNKIVLAGSKTVNRLLHPADFFYNNLEESNCNILYNKKVMKSFTVKYKKKELHFEIYIGKLINNGNLSRFDDYVKIEIESKKNMNINEALMLIKKIKQAFVVLSGNESIIFKYIELINETSYIYINENGSEEFYKFMSVNLYKNEILEKIIKGTIENKKLEYRFFEKNNIEITTLYICRAFEKIAEKRRIKPNRSDSENRIITELLKKLHTFESNGFIDGVENTLNTYNNKFYSHLKWAFDKYYYYFDESNMCWPDFFIKKVGKKTECGIEFDDSAYRLNKLRNNIAHDDMTNIILAEDKNIINGLGYITYIMLLEEFGLSKDEIMLFMTWGMNLFIE